MRKLAPVLVIGLILAVAGALFVIYQDSTRERDQVETLSSLGIETQPRGESAGGGVSGGVRSDRGIDDAGSGGEGGGSGGSSSSEPGTGGASGGSSDSGGGFFGDFFGGDTGSSNAGGSSSGSGGGSSSEPVGEGDDDADIDSTTPDEMLVDPGNGPVGVSDDPDSETVDGGVDETPRSGPIEMVGTSSGTGKGASGGSVGAGAHSSMGAGVWHASPGCVYQLNGSSSTPLNGGLNLVEIRSGDSFSSACTWRAGYPGSSNSVTYGTHVVGKTMGAGVWKPRNAECSFSLLKDLRAGSVVAGSSNYTVEGESVRLGVGDIFLSGSDCGGWAKVG